MSDGIKKLIWLYLVLLFIEGALRKWVFPGAADLLLIVRDPVVLLIYALALASGRFPFNGFITALLVFAAASMAASVAAGQHNPWVMVYGLRINYLHVPLIWVMAAFLERRDVERMGSFTLLMAIPMTLVMVEQFRSPMNAPINRGVGTDELGQIFGADNRIRPPGLFSFITGPQLFLPFAAAFFLHQAAGSRRLPWLLLLAAGVSIAVALPVSISRSAMLATGLVGLTFAAAVVVAPSRGGRLVRTVVIGALLVAALSRLTVFEEGQEVFLERWETAAVGSDGDAWQNVTNRVFGGLGQPMRAINRAPLFGAGIGVGSNVGARLLSGSVGFMLAEDEWTKIIMELGPLLGVAFIVFRIILTVWIGFVAVRALFAGGEVLPVLLFAATGAAVLIYQWAPPTLLGFAVIGSGLVLAAAKPVAVSTTELIPVPPPVALPELPPATPYRPPARPKAGVA